MKRFMRSLGWLCLGALLLAACGPQVTPTSPSSNRFAGGIETEASRDNVRILRLGGAEQALPAPRQLQLQVEEGVDVDQQGRAILRFADLLTVEVLRDGDLTIIELADDQSGIFIEVNQTSGALLNDFDPQEAIDHRFRTVSYTHLTLPTN